MNLLVDIGNSRIKWAFDCDGRLSGQGSLAHNNNPDVEQLDQAWGHLERPTKIAMVSVAGLKVQTKVRQWFEGQWRVPVTQLETQAQCAGVRNGYESPEKLGVDRWAAIVAAYQLARQAVCVIDNGTALTCDAVDAGGRHLGGLIVPGRFLQKKLLQQGTSKIGVITERTTSEMWGTTTETCIESGILQSQLGLVDRCIERHDQTTGESVAVIVTGGDGRALLPYLSGRGHYEPDLVLQGITHMMREH